MNRKLDDILRQALAPANDPDAQLNQKLLERAKERRFMAKRKKGVPTAILVASMVLVFGTLTVGAAYRYLSPSQVADRNKDGKLSQAFLGEDAISIQETQEYGGFRVTLLGLVAGDNLSKYIPTDSLGNVESDRIYTVTAIERADGTPMPDTSDEAYGQESFYVSPYIRGLDPGTYSLMSMGGGYTEFMQDGILYRITEMDNIEIFADRGIYLGISDGTFYNNEAYCFDEATGEITRNEAYTGLNALFSVPMDASKGDPQAAEAYLKALHEEWETPDEPLEMDENDLAVEDFISKLEENPELFLDESLVKRVESTVQTCTPDKDNAVSASWEYGDPNGDNYASGGAYNWMDTLFPKGSDKTMAIGGYNYSEDGLSDLVIEVWTKNADGTATFAIYVPVLD